MEEGEIFDWSPIRCRRNKLRSSINLSIFVQKQFRMCACMTSICLYNINFRRLICELAHTHEVEFPEIRTFYMVKFHRYIRLFNRIQCCFSSIVIGYLTSLFIILYKRFRETNSGPTISPLEYSLLYGNWIVTLDAHQWSSRAWSHRNWRCYWLFLIGYHGGIF